MTLAGPHMLSCALSSPSCSPAAHTSRSSYMPSRSCVPLSHQCLRARYTCWHRSAAHNSLPCRPCPPAATPCPPPLPVTLTRHPYPPPPPVTLTRHPYPSPPPVTPHLRPTPHLFAQTAAPAGLTEQCGAALDTAARKGTTVSPRSALFNPLTFDEGITELPPPLSSRMHQRSSSYSADPLNDRRRATSHRRNSSYDAMPAKTPAKARSGLLHTAAPSSASITGGGGGAPTSSAGAEGGGYIVGGPPKEDAVGSSSLLQLLAASTLAVVLAPSYSASRAAQVLDLTFPCLTFA